MAKHPPTVRLAALVPSRVRRFYASHQLLSWTLVFVVLPTLAALLYGYAVLLRSLPPTRGSLQVAGPRAAVSITRDAQGVARIEARHDSDAFFALGLVHAQDRLWQLELQRRMARGQTSEIFGRGALRFDVFMRTLRLYEAAEASLPALSEPAQAALLAYTAGINSWIESKRELPTEFQFLGIEPQPWKPADCLAWLKVFALNLSLNFRQELDDLALRQALDEPKLRSVLAARTAMPSLARPSEATMAGLARLSELSREMQQFWRIGGTTVGSNAWAIAARHSSNGKAILANDPHLGLELPSIWYAAAIKGDRLEAAGMSMVGLPIIMLGRNPHIAWGGTNLMADTQDLYFEQVNLDDPNQYQHHGQWLSFDSRVETFHIKPDFPAILREPLAPVQVKIRSTVNGPVISDAVAPSGQVITLHWLGGSKSDTSFDAFFQANYAEDASGLEKAMALHVAPALGIVYIDSEDNIGLLATGSVPIRGRGHGETPLEGWLAENAWQGFIPYAEMPHVRNPASGYVIAANNRVTAPDYPYFISNDWAEPARAARIEELLSRALAGGAKLSAADQRAIQMDVVDKQALELLPELLPAGSTDAGLARMLGHLTAWKGQTEKESIASTVFFTWVHHVRRRLFAEQMRTVWARPELTGQLQQIFGDFSLRALQAALTSGEWCKEGKSEGGVSCDQVKLDALRDAQKDLQHLLGEDEDDWNWSAAHHALFAHRPFSTIRGLDLIYERRVATGGSRDSINVAGASFDRSRGFTQSYGAGFRQIMQVGDDQDHWYVNSTGQSGNVLSRHYDDMIAAYAAGDYYALSASGARALERLTVVPR